LYPDSLSVMQPPSSPDGVADVFCPGEIKTRPTRGRFEYVGSPPLDSPPAEIWATYHYGFSSEIGAGPYDRRLDRNAPPTFAPQLPSVTGGGSWTGANAAPSNGTLTLGDSLTYTGADEVTVNGQLTIRADNEQRPLIRLPVPSPGSAAGWVFTANDESCLVLDGLFISGGDIVLRGQFDCVTITCCTLDPGSAAAPAAAGSPPGSFAVAADGRELAPTCLWIEGTITTVTIERSITGPIRTRPGGKVETLTITDSIIQDISMDASDTDSSPPDTSPPEQSANRLAGGALALDDGEVRLSRCTVLGRVSVHQLQASECLLQDLACVDDTQHGCVRFSAWTVNSVLPRKYESVQIPPRAPLFVSTDFGQPGYAQLLASADVAILPAGDASATPQNTISAGAEDGSEIGAFAREKNPIKERGLLIKYQEYMPAGLIPVIIYVT
jgi:hypothetical protein